jgi:hypothetical protein
LALLAPNRGVVHGLDHHPKGRDRHPNYFPKAFISPYAARFSVFS